MAKNEKDSIETIELEIVMLLRRADFKKTLDGNKNSLDRSGYLLLTLLANEGPLSIRVMADRFQLNMSTISRQVHALEVNGLIQRKEDELDARVSLIYISEKGQTALNASKKYRIESYENILEGWTNDEKGIFADLLTRLNRAIEKRRKLQ
ncbi:MarR family winged helix-turn-helix transcriptional regulator [Heyndrickxia acidicola]|uniref:MarR family transcriptional regulator n=1 Tax=Heyndrickxia acidicola TaxID=209389 RepID=A0ABU6MAD8_9BACI|nr:MarR family transcriptional regulator [Heyndrickxia acidicola]MED1201619.1 MarR family transcriptional regulator [Heyndrickxia acidicola]